MSTAAWCFLSNNNVQRCDFDLPILFQGANGCETHWGALHFEWEARWSQWACILSMPRSCFPSSRWVDLGSREKAGCCFCVREGRKRREQDGKAESCPQSRARRRGVSVAATDWGWVDCWFNASGEGEWPVAASFGIDGAGSRRAYAITSIFSEVGWCWVFFVLL